MNTLGLSTFIINLCLLLQVIDVVLPAINVKIYIYPFDIPRNQIKNCVLFQNFRPNGLQIFRESLINPLRAFACNVLGMWQLHQSSLCDCRAAFIYKGYGFLLNCFTSKELALASFVSSFLLILNLEALRNLNLDSEKFH